jgi:hypothetical protein
MMKNEEKILSWYHKEINKDNHELDKIKNDFIKDIKKIEKETIFEGMAPKKLTLWQRIRKVLTGT